MRNTLSGLLVLLVACGSDTPGPAPDFGDAPPLTPGDPVPTTTGVYAGHYEVPASAELAAAAQFPVDEVTWTVLGGVATLHYSLPVGLVGGKLDVNLTGPIAAGATELALTGENVAGTCVAAGTKITCREVFGDLGPLPISMPVVQDVAAREFTGPGTQRVAIANLFSSDPIGMVDFDLAVPAMDDHGDDDGGGDDDDDDDD